MSKYRLMKYERLFFVFLSLQKKATSWAGINCLASITKETQKIIFGSFDNDNDFYRLLRMHVIIHMHPIGGLRLCMGGVCCVSVNVCVVSECQCYVCVVNLWPQRIRTISSVPMPAYSAHGCTRTELST